MQLYYCLTNLTYKYSKLIQVAHAIWSQPQLSNSSIELVCSLIRVLENNHNYDMVTCLRYVSMSYSNNFMIPHYDVSSESSEMCDLLVLFQVIFFEEPPILDKFRFNVLVIHKLGKYVKLLSEKLVCKVYLQKPTSSLFIQPKSKISNTGMMTNIQLTVVFMMPVPCVLMLLAICLMLIVFKCLLLLERSTNICFREKQIMHDIDRKDNERNVKPVQTFFI